MCPFCEQKVTYIDYKNTKLLIRFISQYGRIIPKYYTGVCLGHQKMLSRAVKTARQMALIAYTR